MHKLGVIVPYRDRPIQLRSFKDSITQYLKKNKIKYELIVIDQLDRKDFNRGKLLNIGFKKALELKCDYVVFHDVDMLPIFADYSYSKVPVHLIDYLEVPEGTSRTLNYDYFGGVTIFPCNLFTQINGYSNGYKGWGFEDDDLLLRCKENHIRLENEYIGQQGRTDVSAQFNGESSYVAISNPIKSTPSFTMFCTFEIDSIEPSRYLPSDEFSILSFPGFDTALTYTSFHNFNMTFWDMYERSVSLKSKKFPEGSDIAAVRISQLEEKKFTDVSFFINGKLIDRNQYAKNLRKYKDSKHLIIGAGNPDREEKQNFFKGSISNFALYDKRLSDIEIMKISKDPEFALFTRSDSDNLKVYYDFKYMKDNVAIDLSGNNNHGYGKDIEPVRTFKPEPLEVPRPIRRKGSFLVLEHKENGYKDGYWVNWSGRKNQMRYLEKYRNYKTDYQRDGLSTLHYKLHNEYYESEYKCTTLQVEV